jgi:hypothetical protein
MDAPVVSQFAKLNSLWSAVRAAGRGALIGILLIGIVEAAEALDVVPTPSENRATSLAGQIFINDGSGKMILDAFSLWPKRR